MVSGAATAALAFSSLIRSDDARSGSGTAVPSHIHALEVDPEDGSLFIGSHYGLFRLSEDAEVERVGESYQDTMGLTLVGPDELLASGHPDVAGRTSGQPALLGLIRSTDRGETWASVALSGEADFHGLAYADDVVYGWNSTTGEFMVSTDLEEWTTSSVVELSGFAVDPIDPDHIIGATPAGVVESRDGGRTWAGTTEHALVALSWSVSQGLWGADRGGGLWLNEVGGWRPAGTVPGEPQALLVTADAIHVAVQTVNGRSAIVRSSDRGLTWTQQYLEPVT